MKQPNAQWENWLNLILGVWLFISPWVLLSSLSPSATALAHWNFWIVGAVIAISSGLALQNLKPWEEWVNLVLGAWLIISPWVFGYAADVSLFWNSMLVGLAVAVFAVFALPVAQRITHQTV